MKAGDSVKRELNKKIKEMCDDVGTAAAAQKCPELTEQLDHTFDQCVAAGMSELDAYREVLRNVDKIQEMLDALPVTEKEQQKKARKLGSKTLKRYLDAASACMWIGTVVGYILYSFRTGRWSSSWLIFLWVTIGQILMDMVQKYNDGESLKEVFRKELPGVFWVGVVMLYFMVSFRFGGWALTWLIFLAAVIVQIIFDAAMGGKD